MTADASGLGAIGRGMVEPCPAGATREVADRDPGWPAQTEAKL